MIERIKILKNAVLSMIILMLSLISMYAQDEDHSKHDCIVIYTNNEVDLGVVTQDCPTQNYDNEAIIKYEINCCTNRKIKIIKIKDVQQDNMNIYIEWKAGASTGFEGTFSDGNEFTVTNKKFYVTVKIKSISAGALSEQGNIYFTPTIKVEYCD